jgi:hypothetical protein
VEVPSRFRRDIAASIASGGTAQVRYGPLFFSNCSVDQEIEVVESSGFGCKLGSPKSSVGISRVG